MHIPCAPCTDAELARQMEEVAGRRAQRGARIEDLSRRMRELGTLPADAYDKHKGKSTKVGGGDWERWLKRTA